MSIIDNLTNLKNFTVEPGFYVGAGLIISVDSSGTGYFVQRADGTILLEIPMSGGMITVTKINMTRAEKAAITRVVRVFRPGFTPDWDMWRAMRTRSHMPRHMLVVKAL